MLCSLFLWKESCIGTNERPSSTGRCLEASNEAAIAPARLGSPSSQPLAWRSASEPGRDARPNSLYFLGFVLVWFSCSLATEPAAAEQKEVQKRFLWFRFSRTYKKGSRASPSPSPATHPRGGDGEATASPSRLWLAVNAVSLVCCAPTGSVGRRGVGGPRREAAR